MKTLVIVFLICHAWQLPAKSSPPLVIAVEDDAAPWSNADGSGFANEVVRAAFRAAGVETQLSVLPYARCKEMALQGNLPACFSMSWNEELRGRIEFGDKPLFVCASDYFVRVSPRTEARDQRSLPQGTALGVVIGYEYPPAAYALQREGVLAFEESESEEINLKKLAAGRVDAVLINHNPTKPAEGMIARAGLSGQIRRAFACGTLQSHIGFSTAHPRGAWARKKFNQGHRKIAANGTLKKIEDKWAALAKKKAP